MIVYKLQIAPWLVMGLCFHFFLLRAVILSGLNGPSVCCHSLCEFSCVSHLQFLEDTISFESSTTSHSYSLILPILHRSLSFGGGKIHKDIPICLGVQKFLRLLTFSSYGSIVNYHLLQEKVSLIMMCRTKHRSHMIKHEGL